MVHGKILALEIYFLLILLIQYNIILIMINFRYIILLFANKQWGTSYTVNTSGEQTVWMPLTAKIRIALANVLKAEPEPATCNTFFNTEQSTNSFTIIHNMNNEKYGMVWISLCFI